MAQRRDTKKKWIRGALLVAAIAACNSGAPIGEPKDYPGENQDIIEALNQLPEATVLLYSADGVPQYIVGELGKIDPTQTDALVASDGRLRPALAPIFKAFRLTNDNLALRKVNVDEFGGRHYRYYQKFNGLDVVGGDLVVHVDVKGAITGANGTARGDIAPMLGAVAISEGAANLSIANDARWAGLAGRAVTGSRLVYIQTPAGALYKAYEQIVEGLRGADPVRDKVYVDVERGDVVAVHPTIHHSLNRRIYDAEHMTSLFGKLVRIEGQGPTGDPDVDAVYDNLGTFYNAYHHFWGRDSCDGAGAPLNASVHYSTNYCNAFWNGGCSVVFGDGNQTQNCAPLARPLDVVAHELAHAVTNYDSALNYSGESAGLIESYSDIFAAFVEAYGDGGSNGTLEINGGTFLIGDEVLPPFLRNMCDPAADGVSRDIWTSSLGSVDPHYSSGPNNLVFCLLSKGGMHPRGKTTIMVPAIGIEKAVRIFYMTYNLLTSSSNYAGMRIAAIQAAQILGYDQATQDAVCRAYAAIGVGTCGDTGCGNDTVLTNGGAKTGLSGASDSNTFFCLQNVPSNKTLTITISSGTGDVDLYTRFGSHPTTTTYACRPYLSGNNETCTHITTTAGTWYVMLHGYTAYSGVSLIGSY